MLDPSLRRWCERVRRSGGIAVAMPETSCERMDHPAARTPSCQASVRSACPYTNFLAISVSPALSRLPGDSGCTLKLMKDAAGAANAPQAGVLPSPLAAALAAFERHLRSERSLSPHTVRAYAGDIASLLAYASGQGVDTPDGLGVTELRGWLAIQHESGAARATLARRGAAARAFTAFAHRRGWLATDPGPQLGTPRTRRTLPHVLPRDEMADMLTGLDQAARRTQVTLRTEAAERAGPTDPADATGPSGAEAAVALRDSAVLELLYATGIRVSELCGLDAGHLDQGRRTVRVRGKGDKERTVPVGVPALRAVTRWLDAGRPALATAASGPALFLGVRGGRLDPRTARRIVHERLRQAGTTRDTGPHGIRHSTATPLLEGGADPRSVPEIPGPSPPATPPIYTHVSIERPKSSYRQ